MAEIDTLQVKITANAQAATASLTSLSKALQKVRTSLTGMKDGVSVTDHLSKSLNVIDILKTYKGFIDDVNQHMEYVVDYVDDSLDKKFQFANRDEIFDKSTADTDNFYYCPYEAQNT